MEQVTRRRRRRKSYATQNLIVLIGILLVLLIAVVLVAVFMGGDKPHDTQGTEATIGSDPTQSQQVVGLTVTMPTETSFVTLEQDLVLQGTSDPAQPVTVNGTAVTQNADGSFTHTLQLQQGVNEITVSHKGESVTYSVEYRYAVQSFVPAKQTAYNCGATVQVELFVREGSSVRVTLGDQEVEMKRAKDQVGTGIADGFVRYTGTYKLPTSNTEDVSLGQFTYTVTCDGITETYYSGEITCKKAAEVLSSDPSVTPNYGDYIDVGSGYIVEIITYSAETFNGKTTDDNSDPRNNYLPEGTVDYCSQDVVSNSSMSYMLMRCGRRVYIQKSNYPSGGKVKVVDCYRGTLPDHNEIGFASLEVVDNHTILTLDSLWKAPFYFDLAPQEYINADNRDFRVSRMTAEYVEITFCYATKFEGAVQIPENNPLFRSAELTQNASDCTLRLYLKKTGGFYGWDAYYNEDDQLCFAFLNPAKATTGSNAYGADLTGVRIMLDVGHGGLDGGSPATLPDGTEVDEAQLNLMLSMILKEELESMGATVIMNRTDDSALNVDERIQYLMQEAPDLCIAVHQNAISGYPNHSGAEIMYFTPFSQLASQLIYEQTVKTGIYQKNRLDWYVYYVSRQTSCPVVLTENGYMTNAGDLANMMDEAVLRQKAQAIAKGVAQYFLTIQ